MTSHFPSPAPVFPSAVCPCNAFPGDYTWSLPGQYEHLNLAQVHAALAYYHANRNQIDLELAEEE